jgi:flagellar biogenesis protein FliO
LASSPVRKRAVSASRTGIAEKRPAPRGRRAAELLLEDDAPVRNYALSLTESADEATERRNFALRMSEALRAIEAAQNGSEIEPPRPLRHKVAPAPASATDLDDSVSLSNEAKEQRPPAAASGLSTWLKTLDKMPPIRLPVGPAISWRLGLPALVAVVVVMVFAGRPSARADAQPVRLPSQETYAVQQEAPLFANSTSAAQAAAAPAAQPIGVPEPSSGSFDFFDVGFKLIAVLALAYGSLLLLKRAGIGGAGAAKVGGAIQGMRVVSSLALAPNRTVHVLKVPGGKTLLVGATPNSVNLIADLGDLPEDETPDVASFFDALRGKIGS